jgi:multidrug transporter EmrE-like cation transporter
VSKGLAIACVALTIALTVYGQLILKWQVLQAGSFPSDPAGRAEFLLRLLINPWVLSVFAAAALAAVSWIAAMTRFELSAAYPFISLTFVLVLILSSVFFDEAITPAKTIGVGLILAGLVAASQP